MDNLNDEIEKALGLTKRMEQVKMPDFFYTRLKARMENELIAKPKFNWALKPSFAIPALAFVMLINVVTIGQLVQKNDDTANNQSPIESFQSEYNLNADYGLELY
ncbi:hypothetical protein [uncultured Arcticibacterium sp.]|uniref:hypothetical protein n=1 Tax=uncultured Arcticibacterium sp. TaxID=2173042 RepID=UPI0030F824F2